MTHALDYRQRIDERWVDLWSYGWWVPIWGGTTWTATLRGVVYLGGVAEVRFLDKVGDVHGLRLTRFGSSIIERDVRDLLIHGLCSTHGVRACSEIEISSIYNEIHHRNGFRAIVARRGLQAGSE